MNNLLVPLDFSDESQNALRVAVQMAQKTDAAIQLLHVLEIPSSTYSVAGDVYAAATVLDQVYAPRMQASVEERLTEIAEMVRKQGVSVSFKIAHGSVYRMIEEQTKGEAIDMIIMGTKGASGWHEVFIGSNAEKVIRRSKIPVLTIKHELDLDKVKNILLAVGTHEEEAVEAAKFMQLLTGATCHLLKVFRKTSEESSLEETQQALSDYANNQHFRDYTTNVVFSQWVEEGILDFVTNHTIDLIVIGTHGYKGISHFLLGSHAEDVANHTDLPVLTTKVSW